MKSISKKNVKTFILLIALITALLVYQFVYTPYQEDLAVLDAENEVLETRLNDLLVQVQMEPEYIEGIKQAKEETEAIMDRYGSGNTPEKSIMFLIDLEAAAKASFPSVSFGAETFVFSSMDAPTALGLGVHASWSTLSLSYQSTYEGMKNIMEYIHTYPERMNVEGVTISYDQSTGNLSGSLTVNLYSMMGGLDMYEPPVVSDIPIGINNIFSTLEAPIGSQIPVIEGNP